MHDLSGSIQRDVDLTGRNVTRYATVGPSQIAPLKPLRGLVFLEIGMPSPDRCAHKAGKLLGHSTDRTHRRGEFCRSFRNR